MVTADRNFINSLAKGLGLLMSFQEQNPRMTLTGVAKANQMNLPTAKRYLHTLTTLGFVVKDEMDQTFQLTAKVLRLGSGVFSSMDLRERLMPFMRNINRELDVTTHCAILDGTEVITVERLRSQDVVNLDITAGSRLPVYATSLGKAILAHLPAAEQKALVGEIEFKPLTPHTITDSKAFLRELQQVRARSYAVACEELTLGLKTMAIPIFDPGGSVNASFGVSYPTSRITEDGLEEKLLESLGIVQDQSSTRL